MEPGLSPSAARVDRALNWAVDNWLVGFNWITAAYAALPLLAPVLLALGVSQPANAIYWAYSYACHQLPSHSWFVLGSQMAYCQRDTAIYLAMLAGGVLYARRRFWTRGLPFWAYALLCLPIAVDGGLALFGVRESTPLLRSVTGALFGFASAWFVYPLMDRALASLGQPPGETRREPTTGSL